LYVSNSDPSVENDYIPAQTSFVQKNYQAAIDQANKILQQTNNNPKSRVYRLLAYSYLELKDTSKACDFSNRFLGKATQDELLANDFLLHARVCGRGNPAIVSQDIAKALQLDTVRSRQIVVLNDAIREARAQKQYGLEGQLMLTSHNLRAASANPADLFYIGTLFYYDNNFAKSDSLLSVYITSFPDTVQGYYWRALSRSQIDTGMKQGLAVPDFEKTVQLGETNKERFKSQAVQAAQMLALYYNNVKKDRPAAQAIVGKGLEFDPTNTTLQDLQKRLAGSAPKTPGKASEPKASANGGNAAGNKSKGR
jgi:hypothetical protein